MSLIICPECAKEVSAAAVACPNCGHPFVRPTVQPRVIVNEFVEEESGFPKWAFIPLGLLGVVLLFVLFAFLRKGDDEDQRNINVRIASQQPASNASRETTTAVRPDSPPNQVVVPSTSQPGQIVVPPSAPPPQQTTTTIVPSTETVASDKGTVSLEAKVLSKSGSPQPVRGTRFYLLKKDVQSVLDDADIENDTGQSIVTALGLSVADPTRYGAINRQAMSAISKNAAYNATTDSSGKLQLKDVKPDSYYLFAVTKSGNGFAIWNSPVPITIQPGLNLLNLDPVNPTEVTVQPDLN
jgi:DNA-directed RNA polymerase subunit RPC12/RpoP